MKRILLIAAVALCALAQAQQQRTMAGASPGGNSPYATDAYPGFDELDEMKSPQRHEPSWLWWRRAKKDTGSLGKFHPINVYMSICHNAHLTVPVRELKKAMFCIHLASKPGL